MKYRDLIVWQKAMSLVEDAYRLSGSFPAEERFVLAAQLRRAAISVPSNIAEGHGRKSTGAYLQHLSVATGSLMELETQLRIAVRLGYVDADQSESFMQKSDEVGKMLTSLRTSLNPKSSILDPRS